MEDEANDINAVLDAKEPKIYEISYLLLPTMATEGASEEAGKLISTIESNGGVLLSSGNPEMKELSYAVSREIDRKRKYFDRAYFGWVKFEIAPDKISLIKLLLDDNVSVIRHLVVTTIRNTAPTRDITKRRVIRKPVREEGKISSEIDMDKEIDALIAETETPAKVTI